MNTRSLIVASAMIVSAAAGALGSEADFYANNNRINVIIGFTPGGGVDTYGRLLSRHLGRHIPGNPNLVPQNMPGGAGMTAVRALDTTQPTDGTVIVVFSPGIVIQSVTTPEQVGIDFSDYHWIGSIGQDERICYLWHTAGADGWDEVAGRDRVIMGDNGGGQSLIAQRILDTVYGINMSIVYGYPGTAEKRLAVERGELDGDCGAVETLPADWITEERIRPFIRFQETASSELIERAPYAYDLLAEGDTTSKMVLDLLLAGGGIGRPFMVSRAVPEERVAILREAFDRVMADPEFLAEAERMNLDVTPTPGLELQALIEGLYASPPEVVARANEILSQ